jgi:hypothetical protein
VAFAETDYCPSGNFQTTGRLISDGTPAMNFKVEICARHLSAWLRLVRLFMAHPPDGGRTSSPRAVTNPRRTRPATHPW